MTPEPEPDAAEVAALRAERDEYAARAAEAETLAEELADELAEARRLLAGQETTSDPRHLTLFDEAAPATGSGTLAADGSDRAVLPIALAATAVVAALVAVLAIANRGLSVFTLVMVAVAGGLAWAAWRTRVQTVRVEVDDGVVEIERAGATKRFDLRSDQVKLDVRGRPGDADWRVRFYRRSLDPVDVDSTMVDPTDFLARLREHRPSV